MCSLLYHTNMDNNNMSYKTIHNRPLSLPAMKLGVEDTDEDFMLACYLLIKSHVGTGSSTVAIDNKIEAAMDLVKSHLMFAVREEVEVLKEQIKGLIETNKQLELENRALRQNAPAEVLASISQTVSPDEQPPSASS